MAAEGVARPLPEPSADSRPYWEGLCAHRLVLQRCRACGTFRHYPRPLCARCFAFDCDWVEASGRGTIHSWTIAHHAFHRAFERATPYIIVLADLPEGVRLAAPLAAPADTPLAPGLPVVLEFEDLAEGLCLPRLSLVI